MEKRIVSAGHICLDITPVFPEGKNTSINNILQPGKLIEMGNANVSTGGSVANTGIAMKLLGANVSLMGKVGKDPIGDMILGILEKYQVQGGMVQAEGEASSYSVVLAIPGIDRIFLHCPGANNTYTVQDIREDVLKDAALFHFGYPPLMKTMYENDGEGLVALLSKARNMGCATSMDMAAIDTSSDAARADWENILKKTLPLVDFFVPSVEELCFMLDRKRFDEWQQRAAGRDITEILDLEQDIKPLADRCMDMGTKVLLLKCGKPGLYYRSAQAEALKKISSRLELNIDKWADREGFEKSFKPSRVRSGTGAGDTSIAGFLTAMINGESIEEAVELASAVGASCVEEYDALSGITGLDKLKERINSGWEKNIGW